MSCRPNGWTPRPVRTTPPVGTARSMASCPIRRWPRRCRTIRRAGPNTSARPGRAPRPECRSQGLRSRAGSCRSYLRTAMARHPRACAIRWRNCRSRWRCHWSLRSRPTMTRWPGRARSRQSRCRRRSAPRGLAALWARDGRGRLMRWFRSRCPPARRRL